MRMLRYSFKAFAIFSLVVFNSCFERELFDKDLILPSISGLYTEISGNISGKLLRQNSPYIVTNDLIVDNNDSLFIEPGVILFFNERSKLIVKGYLRAEGTRNQRIYFTAYKSSWDGISFISSNKNSRIRLSIIEKINPTEEINSTISGISFVNSSCVLLNNYFRNNRVSKGTFINSLNSNVTVKNNIFLNNNSNQSLINSDNNRLILINNVLFNNQTSSNQSLVSIKNSIYNDIQNNIFYRNKSLNEIQVKDSEPQKVVIDYNFFGSNTNDPQFWNYETFRLYYTSPCIDAGNPAPEFNDLNGSRNDQGAYGGPDGGW